MISKILVALDGSEHANHALIYALDLAEKYSASIILLSVAHHVYIPSSGDSMDFITPQVIQECMEAEKTHKEKMLSQAVEKIEKGKPNLHVTTKLKEGPRVYAQLHMRPALPHDSLRWRRHTTRTRSERGQCGA